MKTRVVGGVGPRIRWFSAGYALDLQDGTSRFPACFFKTNLQALYSHCAKFLIGMTGLASGSYAFGAQVQGEHMRFKRTTEFSFPGIAANLAVARADAIILFI